MKDYDKGRHDAFDEIYSWVREYKFGKKNKEQIVNEIRRYCFEQKIKTRYLSIKKK